MAFDTTGAKNVGEALGGLASFLEKGLGTRGSGIGYTRFRPEDLAAIEKQRGVFQQGIQGPGGLLEQLAKARENIQTGVQAAPGTFTFQMSPDAMTRALASQAAQGLSQQAAAQRAQIAQQFRGQPGASRALQAQADIATRLQQNPLLFQAFQQQQGRELAQAQQNQAAREAANQAIMQREQLMANLGMNISSQQQNLLQQLLGYGQALGRNINEQETQGFLGRIFG
jgi:hypothetical protein